ncbi:hypothetical protein NQ315_013964 [Exocentrus adspersus]|uniref:Glycolipid transfer protein domain-containing protein n=1 Tax=Exocentrus adspersus TaxID=1586481 RepID=A0AAV8VRJ9_9CUCU|nr:hypothetical protein NQ315_013964 [Exocentrus adspersus]
MIPLRDKERSHEYSDIKFEYKESAIRAMLKRKQTTDCLLTNSLLNTLLLWQLFRFFTLMGTVFGFVSKDLKAKMDILRELLKDSSKSDKFITVKEMIEYEIKNDLLNKKGYTSGSRTLLRLHRGLGCDAIFCLN